MTAFRDRAEKAKQVRQMSAVCPTDEEASSPRLPAGYSGGAENPGRHTADPLGPI